MLYGLFGVNQNVFSDPDAAIAVAQAAEAAGFDSLWVGEHIVLPEPLTPPPFMSPDEPILDPIVTLSFLAACTERLLLGTGVIVLPQRNPLVLAKELASLDVLSKGRLIFGLGVGYLAPEMNAVGVPMEQRGIRSDEYLSAILNLWLQPNPAFNGRFVAFGGVQAYPRPVQRPRPPIVIGGRTPAAHRRAVRYGDGWYGFNLSLEETVEQIGALREALGKYRRDPNLGQLEISVTPRDPVGTEEVRQYAESGVHRLILRLPRDCPISEALAFVRLTGEILIASK